MIAKHLYGGLGQNPFNPAMVAFALMIVAYPSLMSQWPAVGFTDFLVRVFSNDIAPLRHARGLGLMALEVFPPLKSFVARRMIFGARG